MAKHSTKCYQTKNNQDSPSTAWTIGHRLRDTAAHMQFLDFISKNWIWGCAVVSPLVPLCWAKIQRP